MYIYLSFYENPKNKKQPNGTKRQHRHNLPKKGHSVWERSKNRLPKKVPRQRSLCDNKKKELIMQQSSFCRSLLNLYCELKKNVYKGMYYDTQKSGFLFIIMNKVHIFIPPKTERFLYLYSILNKKPLICIVR